MLRFALLRTSRVTMLKQLSTRYMHTTIRILKAHPFDMPAMSPTMEQGGIVEWKYKVGDTFSAGDVILEIETDKAQIDVEAQDDGKLAKIIMSNGTKDIPVGKTIAYLADLDDDISTLSFPSEANSSTPKTPKNEKASKKEKTVSETIKRDTTKKDGSKGDLKSAATTTGLQVLQQANPNQTILPSVSQLLAAKGISKEEALKKIKSSGKGGRLLKGDVLAYLGLISEDAVVSIAKYLKNAEHLDLSNIELKKEPVTPVEEEKSKNLKKIVAKPEPIVLTEELTLRTPKNVSVERLTSSIESFIDEAYQFTHDQHVADVNSDFYDPLFEDLITPSPTEPRFDVTYQLIPLNDEYAGDASDDIFDLLAGSGEEAQEAKLDKGAVNEYILNVNVHVNDKFYDSKEKSERFIKYLKQLELV